MTCTTNAYESLIFALFEYLWTLSSSVINYWAWRPTFINLRLVKALPINFWFWPILRLLCELLHLLRIFDFCHRWSSIVHVYNSQESEIFISIGRASLTFANAIGKSLTFEAFKIIQTTSLLAFFLPITLSVVNCQFFQSSRIFNLH